MRAPFEPAGRRGRAVHEDERVGQVRREQVEAQKHVGAGTHAQADERAKAAQCTFEHTRKPWPMNADSVSTVSTSMVYIYIYI